MMALYQQTYIICPWCAEESGCRVDHLFGETPRTWGPWHCDECRKPFVGRVNADKSVTVEKDEKNPRAFVKAFSLLKLDGKDGPVFFIMKDNRYVQDKAAIETPEEYQEHQRFFYEEHSCPTNWLRNCVAVIENGDTDPHGFLEFIRQIDRPADFTEEKENNDEWASLFPEAFP